MSSWSVWILILKLLWGNVFLKNHAKSKVFQTHKRQRGFFSKSDVKLLILIIAAEVSTKPLNSPFGVQRNLHTRRGAPSLPVCGWVDGVDGLD